MAAVKRLLSCWPRMVGSLLVALGCGSDGSGGDAGTGETSSTTDSASSAGTTSSSTQPTSEGTSSAGTTSTAPEAEGFVINGEPVLPGHNPTGFAFEVALAGDVDGDGFEDVVIGSYVAGQSHRLDLVTAGFKI